MVVSLTGKPRQFHHAMESRKRVGYFRVLEEGVPGRNLPGRRYLHPQARLYHKAMEEVTAFVLAGGQSIRMGADKAFLEVGGRSLLSRALGLARTVIGQVKIVGDPDKFRKFGEVITDHYHDHGPLAGIHAALSNSESDWNLILAVDLPFLTGEFLRYLISQAHSSGAVVTAPQTGAHFHPLCSVYRKEFGVFAERSLKAGKNKIDSLFSGVSLRTIGDEELARECFEPAIFRNVNTPEEWEEAKRELAK
jgi:molybdenum cofactor guanylyltransferase